MRYDRVTAIGEAVVEVSKKDPACVRYARVTTIGQSNTQSRVHW